MSNRISTDRSVAGSDGCNQQAEHGGSGGGLASIGSICAVLLAGFLAWRWVESAGGAEALLEQFGSWAPLVSIPIHILLSATPFPSELVGIASGSVYGLLFGTLYAWVGWWSGAVLEYAVVRLGAKQFEPRDDRLKLPNWLRRFPVHHPIFLIVGRQLPFGFHAINIAAGVGGVSPLRHIICAGISNLPYAFLTAAIGAGLIIGASSAGAAQDSPVGRWTTTNDTTGEVESLVEIWQEDGALSGRVVKLVVGPTENPNPLCNRCEGERRNQRIVGMQIIWDLVADGEGWGNGQIIDPGNGRIYRCNLALSSGGNVLEVRGYIGFSLFGRTQRWVRAQ
jgi:uncharacterized membrane protein YdjX (TVP38/TMEM64 family)